MGSHTGYVHGLIDNNYNFAQFASTCAYAFGALHQYRDDNCDRTKLPDNVKEIGVNCSDSYYEKSLKNNSKEYAELKKYKKAEKIAYGVKFINKCIKENAQGLKVALKEKKIIQDMIVKVNDWQPPTPDHINFKEFMLNQLNQSTFMDDYYRERLDYYNKITPLEIYNTQLKYLKEEIERCKKLIREEKEKKENAPMKCGEWVKLLKQSLEKYN